MVEGFKPPRPEGNDADKGSLNAVRQLSNTIVQSGTFPTDESLGYKSTMGIYGGTLTHDADKKYVFDMRGAFNRWDQWGDRQVRAFDDHIAKDPLKLWWKKSPEFWDRFPLKAESKRYRGSPQEAVVGAHPDGPRIERLGLQDMYGLHPWGIEIKDPERFTHSVGLQDIFRADVIKNSRLPLINRFEALGVAAAYLSALHKRLNGGIAEANTYAFLFAKHEGQHVGEPFLMLPTEIYNPAIYEKQGDMHDRSIEQKSTDLLDLLASASFEELRRSQGNWESVDRALDVVLKAYKDNDVVDMVASYARRGRLVLPQSGEDAAFDKTDTNHKLHSLAALHNTQRLTADPKHSVEVKKHIIDRCENFSSMVQHSGLVEDLKTLLFGHIDALFTRLYAEMGYPNPAKDAPEGIRNIETALREGINQGLIPTRTRLKETALRMVEGGRTHGDLITSDANRFRTIVEHYFK